MSDLLKVLGITAVFIFVTVPIGDFWLRLFGLIEGPPLFQHVCGSKPPAPPSANRDTHD